MIRSLKYFTLKFSRRHNKSADGLISRMLHTKLVLWNRESAARGAAIGMFWAFMPIPFQMFPAFLFCWMMAANLPIALLCVWITNPLTLIPILLLEYRLGQAVLSTDAAHVATEASVMGWHMVTRAKELYVGAIAVSSAAMFTGYLFIHSAFKLSETNLARRRRKTAARIALFKHSKVSVRKKSGGHSV